MKTFEKILGVVCMVVVAYYISAWLATGLASMPISQYTIGNIGSVIGIVFVWLITLTLIYFNVID
jgi:hypothetical protein